MVTDKRSFKKADNQTNRLQSHLHSGAKPVEIAWRFSPRKREMEHFTHLPAA